jgi:hypothetical protein
VCCAKESSGTRIPGVIIKVNRIIKIFAIINEIVNKPKYEIKSGPKSKCINNKITKYLLASASGADMKGS